MESLTVPAGYDPLTQRLKLRLNINAINAAFPPMTFIYVAITNISGVTTKYGTSDLTDVTGHEHEGKIYFDVYLRQNPSNDTQIMFCAQWASLETAPMEPDNWLGCNSYEYVHYDWDGVSELCLWYPKAMAAAVPTITIESSDTVPTPTVDNKLDITPYMRAGVSMIWVSHASAGDGVNHEDYVTGSCSSEDPDTGPSFDFTATPETGCASLEVQFNHFLKPVV